MSVAPVIGADWRPTVDEVAAILRSRTQDDNMKEIGTFTDATRPTDAQVDELIDLAIGALVAECGVEPCNELLAAGASSHTALTTALLVELSYFPEQVRSDRSPWQQLKDLWDDMHATVVQSISYACGTGDGGGGEDGGVPIGMPAWNYDDWSACPWRAPGAEYQVAWEGWIGRFGTTQVQAAVALGLPLQTLTEAV